MDQSKGEKTGTRPFADAVVATEREGPPSPTQSRPPCFFFFFFSLARSLSLLEACQSDRVGENDGDDVSDTR